MNMRDRLKAFKERKHPAAAGPNYLIVRGHPWELSGKGEAEAWGTGARLWENILRGHRH